MSDNAPLAAHLTNVIVSTMRIHAALGVLSRTNIPEVRHRAESFISQQSEYLADAIEGVLDCFTKESKE